MVHRIPVRGCVAQIVNANPVYNIYAIPEPVFIIEEPALGVQFLCKTNKPVMYYPATTVVVRIHSRRYDPLIENVIASLYDTIVQPSRHHISR